MRPTMTSGGETSVLMSRATLTKPHSRPNFFISDASVIFTALAERIRNITEILGERKKKKSYGNIVLPKKASLLTYDELRARQTKPVTLEVLS